MLIIYLRMMYIRVHNDWSLTFDRLCTYMVYILTCIYTYHVCTYQIHVIIHIQYNMHILYVYTMCVHSDTYNIIHTVKYVYSVCTYIPCLYISIHIIICIYSSVCIRIPCVYISSPLLSCVVLSTQPRIWPSR